MTFLEILFVKFRIFFCSICCTTTICSCIRVIQLVSITSVTALANKPLPVTVSDQSSSQLFISLPLDMTQKVSKLVLQVGKAV